VLKQRILTAVVWVPLVLYLVLVANSLWLAGVVGLVVVLGAWEWCKIAGIESITGQILYVLFIVLLLYFCFISRQAVWMPVIILIAVCWWLMAMVVLLGTQRQWFIFHVTTAIKAVIGLVILVPAWLSLLLLQDNGTPEGRSRLLLLLLIIWTADIAAYFSGRAWGKHTLASRISPGKTWEGAFGAIIASLLMTVGFIMINRIQHDEISVYFVLGLIAVPVSIIGDLFESLMKRAANLKDSGKLLPGHGGVLDRIDSLTAAGPVFYAGYWLSRYLI